MRFKKVTQTAVGAAVVIGSLAVGVGYAQADYAPSATDVIGISGVTPQVSFDFLADGDNQGDSGYNASNNPNKLVNFDATADLNGRNPYLQNSATSLNPTVAYRAGTSPVQRVRSTGNAYTAFAQDTGSQKVFNFIGAANAPTAAQQAAATPPNSLHVVQIGTDGVKIVASNTTNAPAGLTRAQLLGIYKGTYTAWNQIPGNAGGSAATIKPYIPPADSAINKALINELTIQNGGAVHAGSWRAVRRAERPGPARGRPQRDRSVRNRAPQRLEHAGRLLQEPEHALPRRPDRFPRGEVP